MIGTNMKSSSDLNTTDALRSIFKKVGLTMEEVELPGDEDSPPVSGSLRTLQSALAALSEGRVRALVEQFADSFRFNDHALTLEFTDKARLTDFFEKSRELFPDRTFEIVFTFESGDHAIAEWRLSETESVSLGSIGHRVPISLQGSTIIRVKNGKIVRWSEYYDQGNPPIKLATFFTERRILSHSSE
jgi:ketosteroid isomerase-like protein